MKNKFPLWQYAVAAASIMLVSAMFLHGLWLAVQGGENRVTGCILVGVTMYIGLVLFLYYKINKPNE